MSKKNKHQGATETKDEGKTETGEATGEASFDEDLGSDLGDAPDSIEPPKEQEAPKPHIESFNADVSFGEESDGARKIRGTHTAVK